MRRISKYSVISLLCCAVVTMQFSCRAKGKAVEVPADAASLPQGVYPEGWFGSLYVDGCAQRMKGNLQESLRLFNECLKMQPSNPAVHYELGTVHKLLGNNQQAIIHAKTCATSNPENEWYQLLLVDAYKSAGQYGNAIKVRETLAKKFPSRSDFKEDLAIDYAVTGQFEKSFRIYEQLENEFGVNEQLTMNKVKLLRSQGKNGDVEEELLRLVASDSNEVQFLAYLAEFYVDQRQYEKARGIYERILSVDPANATVHLALHDYYSQKGDDAKALDHLRKGFRNAELDVETKAGITGSFFRRAEQNDEEAARTGMELAEIMLQVHPKAAESNALFADFLMLENKREEAAKFYYAAAMVERKDGRVWENLLHIEYDLKKFDSVQKHSAMAMELFPNRGRLYLYNGHAHVQNGNYASAARALRDGLEFTGGDRELQTDLLRLLGDAYHQLREHSKSDEAFDQVLKLQPDNAYVLNNYAYYLSLRNHNLEHAARLSRQSLELQPANRNYMDTYGWILYKQGKYDEAVDWLTKASSGSKSPVIMEHLGDALFKSGKPAEAFKWWDAARDAGAKSAALDRKIRERKLDE